MTNVSLRDDFRHALKPYINVPLNPRYQRVGVEENAVDARFHQKLGEGRIIAGRLSAQTDLGIRTLSRVNHLADHLRHRRVTSPEQVAP